jgi:hypothetical protein
MVHKVPVAFALSIGGDSIQSRVRPCRKTVRPALVGVVRCPMPPHSGREYPPSEDEFSVWSLLSHALSPWPCGCPLANIECPATAICVYACVSRAPRGSIEPRDVECVDRCGKNRRKCHWRPLWQRGRGRRQGRTGIAEVCLSRCVSLIRCPDRLSRLQPLAKILTLTSSSFAHSLAEPIAPALADLVKKQSFTHVVAAHSAVGKNIFPRLAALLDAAQVCAHIYIIFTHPYIYHCRSLMSWTSSRKTPLCVRSMPATLLRQSRQRIPSRS